MFQLARQKQRNVDIVRTPAATHAPGVAVGKRTLTAQLGGQHLGAPDYYTRAVESTLRELRAVRATALPGYIAVLRKRDLEPLAKQIELSRAAMQVRYMLTSANKHVYALEAAAPYRDPMVAYLRADLDVLVARAVKLGVYRDAEELIPQRFVEDTSKQGGKTTHELAKQVTKHRPAPTRSAAAPTRPAEITRSANTPRARLARGTGPVTSANRSAPAPRASRVARSAPAARGSVQRKRDGSAYRADVRTVAAQGVAGASAPLPYASQIQRAFGRHDIAGIRVQVGGAAAMAARSLGATAYATGNTIAFASAPDLHTAAHEAVHVLQQRAGISLPGDLDDGSSDVYEQQADRIADAVVAGRSVEHMLDELRGPGATTAVQRKRGGDSSYEFSHSSSKRPLRLKAFDKLGVTATYKWQWQAALKNDGTLGTKGKTGAIEHEAKLFSRKAALERTGKKFERKLQAELAKHATKLTGEPFDLGVGLTVQVKSKALDAAISTDKLDLKLATISLSIEGDFSKWLGTEHFEVKGSVSIDLELGAAAAKNILEIAQAGRDLEKAIKFEKKLSSVKRQLRELDLPTNNLGGEYPLKRFEQGRLRAQLDRLEKMRGSFNKLREAALGRIRKIGGKLAKSATGEVLQRVAARALASVFTKLIPGYNIISTAADLLEVVSFFVNYDWDKERGGGGSGTGDGTGNGEGAGQGDKVAEGDAAGADIPEDFTTPAEFQRMIDEYQNVELHPAARDLMALLYDPGTAQEQFAPLSPEEARLLNGAIPEDLDKDEIELARKYVRTSPKAGAERLDTVFGVLAVIRPNGERVLQGPAAKPPAATLPKRPRKPRKARKPAARSGPTEARKASQIIDTNAILTRAIHIDRQKRMTVPSVVAFPGFTVRPRVFHRFVAYGDPTQGNATYYLDIELTSSDVPAGTRLIDSEGYVRILRPNHPLRIMVLVEQRDADRGGDAR